MLLFSLIIIPKILVWLDELVSADLMSENFMTNVKICRHYVINKELINICRLIIIFFYDLFQYLKNETLSADVLSFFHRNNVIKKRHTNAQWGVNLFYRSY
jgi:hypothetical protein